MRLPEALKRAAETYSSNPALKYKKQALDYAALWSQSDALAAQLQQRGIKPGDRVGILSDHGIEPVVIFFAILKSGAIAVHFNEHLQVDGLAEIIADCQPRLIFTARRFKDERLAHIEFANDTDILVIEEQYNELTRSSNPNLAEFDSSGKDIATIVYTSGSTGKPKGVCLSHDGLMLAAATDAQLMNITDRDIYLMLVPLHYVHGLLQLLIHISKGATIEFAGNFLFPRAIIKKLADSKATGFSGVPFHLIALLDRAGLATAELPDLRWLAVTGGQFPLERIKQLINSALDIDIFITYGQTECSPRITALSAEKIKHKPDSVGAPPAGIEIKLFDDDNNPVAQGETGEVVVKGDNLMVGYWGDPQGTAEVIDQQGWLHTGDLGYFDQEGDLFLAGRKQAMIKSAGERIFPDEIERVVLGHEAVAEVAVVGVPDPLYGQRIEAHLQLGAAQTQNDSDSIVEDVRRYCLERMPFARAPKAYHLWDKLPRKANGKVDRQALLSEPVPATLSVSQS